MKQVDDAERATFHKMLDDALDARERIDSDGLARDSLMDWSCLLFKKLVDRHGVELHRVDDGVGPIDGDSMRQLISICRWAGKTLPDKGDITAEKAYEIARDLEALFSTAPNVLTEFGPGRSKRQRRSPEDTNFWVLAVSWVFGLEHAYKSKKKAQAIVAEAFGISSRQLSSWENEINAEPAHHGRLNFSKLPATLDAFGEVTDGSLVIVIAEDDRNLMVANSDYTADLTRHGQAYKKFKGKNP